MKKGFNLSTEESNKPQKENAPESHELKIIEIISNRIYFYSEIDRKYILRLNKALREMKNNHISEAQIRDVKIPNPIYLHINSYGGSIFAGIAGMDEILNTNKFLQVHTIIDGCCASAGTFLSIVGKKRYINKHAYMLIHQLSSIMWGKYEEFKDEMQNLDKLMEMIRGFYKTYTKIPAEKIEGILKHDLFFDANQCKEYGLVDEII